MPKMVLLAEYVAVNGVDLSAYAKKAELTTKVEEKDVTTYGSQGWKELLGGLKSGELALDLFQDVAASALDSIMWPLLGTVVTFEVRASNAVVGTSNPKYTGSVLINAWNPISGSVGDEASVGVSYPTSGAVTRGTT
ncbi:phage tail tube protein [Streptomyces sp. NBC_01571]|uniref:phage tail tube protein n=1 Tax=Streptomyces sp. NBC_01571 TaxID=2975883 RepID=UPI00224D1D78|nr:phage tail tube protein [Streptomyces sp. NBC_01571]MCX4578114.1 phage tail tube protein [Streptomyces sp. NBC_01571]